MNILGCKYAPQDWKDISTDPSLPVPDNTVMMLSCNEVNHRIKGSSRVTCVQGKPYKTDIEPSCSLQFGKSVFAAVFANA